MKFLSKPPVRRFARFARRALKDFGRRHKQCDRYLWSCKGVIHVGANSGQERETYRICGLRVVWIEPIPELYDTLINNLKEYGDQLAIQALITDDDDQKVTLHVSNNDGLSSSIFDLNQHRDIWPDVEYVTDIQLRSMRLTTALRSADIDWTNYDALIMDTQGSELLVLKGAVEILPLLKYIKTEAADFEAYKNCTTLTEISEYLARFGFRLIEKHKFAERCAGGAYYNVLYERTWQPQAAG